MLLDTKMCINEMQLFIVLNILWGFTMGCTWTDKECKLKQPDSLCEAVTPRILLPNGTKLWNRRSTYILYGEPLELFCTGRIYDLQFTNENNVRLPATSVNKTTIRLYKEKPEKGFSYYICQYIKRINEFYEKSHVTVIVESLPVVENFNCKSMHFEYLNCSWTSNNYMPTFLLYYVFEGIPTLLCNSHFYDEKKHCLWDKNHPLLRYEDEEKNLTFIMNTCNRFGCTNQTFIIDHRAHVKYQAPIIELRSKSSFSVVLGLSLEIDQDIGNIFLEQKISYWYSGIDRNQTNASLARINNYDNDFDDDIELKLPCANEFYEVRASVRPQLAVGEDYWSDDGVIHFVTEKAPEEVNEAVNLTCNQTKAPITRDVMLYIIVQRKEKIKEEQNELKQKIKSLRSKADRG